MLREVDPHISNLMFLQDEVIPHILGLPTANSQDSGDLWDLGGGDFLNLNVFCDRTSYPHAPECGTVGCVLGWYMKMRYNLTNTDEVSGRCGLDKAIHEFDISPEQAGYLFAAYQCASHNDQYEDVKSRAVFLNTVIDEKIAELV